jgi:hypothetical protein
MSTTAEERPLGRLALHATAALGIAVAVGGLVFFLVGTISTLLMRGTEAIEGTFDGVIGAILFAIVLVGLFGGVPGALIGIAFIHYRVTSVGAFVAAGIAASLIAPLLVMALTPLGFDGWSMLIVAIPAGAAAGAAAWWYLCHHTELLAPARA